VAEPEPFQIAIPEDALNDFNRRLAMARLPPSQSVADREPGDPAGQDDHVIERVAGLVAYWRDGYNWRAQERRMNAVPQYRATVDGVGLHFVHVPGAGPDPMPLLLCNGWPSSIVEYLGVLSRLTDPATHGGDPADSFTVVAPALPGYGFSDRCLDRRPTRVWIADLFHRLMVELGYPRYVAHGDDIGGGVINRLGLRHPPGLLAVQTANPISPYLGPTDRLTPAEQSFVDASDRWHRDLGAYDHVQATRPRTLSVALNDSPVGLAAWILEKWLTWSDPATRDRLSPDDLLTNVMIYWLTETIGSSIRLYVPATAAGLGPGQAVTAPTSVLIPHEPYLPVPPESWLRRAYPAMERFVVVNGGGHFLAAEDPDRFVAEVREAFRPHRGR
jgi:pimeloyl-ACP methyl ester carboxylesterase